MVTCLLQAMYDSQWKANYILYLIPSSVQASTGKSEKGKEAGLSDLQEILTSPSSSELSLPHVDAKDAATWLVSLQYSHHLN